MYLCCGRNNNVLGRAETEEEAQEMCNTVGSSYIKIIPILFWLMRNHNKFYTYNTTKGFLSYKKLISKIKEISKLKYNKTKKLDFEEMISVVEELLGDCSDLILKNLR